MNAKQYTLGEVKYGYSVVSKKWEFHVPSLDTTFLAKCPNRASDAQRVAKILIGAAKRGQIDGLARSNIAKLGVI